MTINRFCSSGLQAIAMAAQQMMTEGTPVAIGAGVEFISLVQMGGMNTKNITEEHLMADQAGALDVDDRDGRDRRRTLQGQPRAPGPICARKPAAAPPPRSRPSSFKDEIVPLQTKMKKVDKATGQESIVDVTVDRDECNRPDTTLEGLAGAQARVHAAAARSRKANTSRPATPRSSPTAPRPAS